MKSMLAMLVAGAAIVAGGVKPGLEQRKTMTEAKGSFDVKLIPGAAEPGMVGTQKLALDKVYHGDLEATGSGVMLSAGDPGQGSAGYVAMERVTGTLSGRTGSFALMQMGAMSPGAGQQLTVTVVPGSGTGDLSGIFGGMEINIAAGKHSYALNYAFAGK